VGGMLGSSPSLASLPLPHRIWKNESCRIFSAGMMIGGLIVFAIVHSMSSNTISHRYVHIPNANNLHETPDPTTRGISSVATPSTPCPKCPMCMCDCPICPSSDEPSVSSPCPSCPEPTPSAPPVPPPEPVPTPATPCATPDTSKAVVTAWPVKPSVPWYTQADGEKRGVLIGYHYFEDEVGRDNLKFFLETGVMQYLGQPDVHFVFILASGCSIKNWPTPPAGMPNNIFITHRGNHG